MFDDKNDARWPTLIAGLILLIVLAAVAAMSAGLDGVAETDLTPQASSLRTRLPAVQRPEPGLHAQVIMRKSKSLEPIAVPMSARLAEDALVGRDVGMRPFAAVADPRGARSPVQSMLARTPPLGIDTRRPPGRNGNARRMAAPTSSSVVYHTGRARRVNRVEVARPPMTTTAIESI